MLDRIIETTKDLLNVGKTKYLVYVFLIAHITTFVFTEDSLQLWEEVVSQYINANILLFLQNFFIVTIILYSIYLLLREASELLIRLEIGCWIELKIATFAWLFFLEYVCFSLVRGVCSFGEFILCYGKSLSLWIPFICFLIVFLPKAILDEIRQRREQRDENVMD